MTGFKEGYSFETLAIRAGQVRTPRGVSIVKPFFRHPVLCLHQPRKPLHVFRVTNPVIFIHGLPTPLSEHSNNAWQRWKARSPAWPLPPECQRFYRPCLALLKSGDHIVSSRSIFGSTTGLFTNYFEKLGIETSFVDLADFASWQTAIRPQTRMLFLENTIQPTHGVGRYPATGDPGTRQQLSTGGG